MEETSSTEILLRARDGTQRDVANGGNDGTNDGTVLRGNYFSRASRTI
jgi:hypothetical protein